MPIQATRRLLAAIRPLLPKGTVLYPPEAHSMMAPYLYALTPNNGAFLFLPDNLSPSQVSASVYKHLRELLEPAGVKLNHLAKGRTIRANPDHNLDFLLGTIANFGSHEIRVHVCILKALQGELKSLDDSDADLADDVITRHLSNLQYQGRPDRFTNGQQQVLFAMPQASGAFTTKFPERINDKLTSLGIDCPMLLAPRRPVGSRVVTPKKHSGRLWKVPNTLAK